MSDNAITTFETELSRWRQYRKLSQLELALEADVSQRHISYLENGRAKPSRSMLLRLCDAMVIPYRERNNLLTLAGFAVVYQERNLDEPVMQPILNAIDSMLTVHEPLPAVVIDRFWNVVKQNKAAENWFSTLLNTPEMQALLDQEGGLNLALMTMHPSGLRQYISNWQEVFPLFVRRLIQEVNLSGDSAVKEKLSGFLSMSELTSQQPIAKNEDLLPVMPLKLTIGELNLSLFSIISTIGTAQDITADELRVESFYPADEATKHYFASLLSVE